MAMNTKRIDLADRKPARPRRVAALGALLSAMLISAPAAALQDGEGEMQHELHRLLGEAAAADGADDGDTPEPEAGPEGPEARDGEAVQPDGRTFRFSAFAEPVELTVLVNFVRDQLEIPIIATDAGLVGETVVLTAPIEMPVEDVLPFLTFLLEQKNYTLTREVAGIYVVRPKPGVDAFIDPENKGATRVIPTPGIRPTTIKEAVEKSLGGDTQSLTFLDDLGVIVVTDTPRRGSFIASLVERLAHEQSSMRLHRIELDHVAASQARQRILELVGAVRQDPTVRLEQQRDRGAAPTLTFVQPISNLSDRLTVDPQGNALIFRGRQDESESLKMLLAVVDVPNRLESRWYPVGRGARAVAAEGRRQGLGDVTISEEEIPQPGQPQQFRGQIPGMPQMQLDDRAGPGFVIYPEVGGFMYRGTRSQHERVEELVEALSELTVAERVVYEFYKLRHARAEDVAELLRDLIAGQVGAGDSPLIGRDLGRRQPDRRAPRRPAQPGEPGEPGEPADPGNGELGEIIPMDEIFVLADQANNQVVVKAPLRLQPQFARLIDKLDLRRPQVFIDAKIITVTATDDFRLAFETQLMSASGEGGIVNIDFGLGRFPDGAEITERKLVPPGLAGLTAALIRSDQVPIIIHALRENVDARLVATPQLLVDDNEEATIASFEEQPTTRTVVGTATTEVAFDGFEEAGTTLTVTPQISEGGYMRLNYMIEQSQFIGASPGAGIPPPRRRDELASESVTVPSDMTIVVGGLTIDSESDTVIRVPLIGSIPLIGHLFRDTRKGTNTTTLYVFITPRIMRDPDFADLRLLTRGPLADAGLPDPVPDRLPARIEILEVHEVFDDGPAGGTE